METVRLGLSEHICGKVIVACGTGKTFTALKIAEDQAGSGKQVLILVPSLALMAQTVRDWTNDGTTPLRSFAGCVDRQIGEHCVDKEDVAEITPLASRSRRRSWPSVFRPDTGQDDHSLCHLSADPKCLGCAELKHGMGRFDLITCNEALVSKSFVVPPKLPIHGRDHIRIAVRIHPLIQGPTSPHQDHPQHLPRIRPAGRRDTHRIIAKFIRLALAHGLSPLLHNR